MNKNNSNLPPLLADIAGIAGESAALKIMSEFGGQEINVPSHPAANQVIWSRCGEKAAKALSELRGGEKISIPNGAHLRSKKLAILQSKGTGNGVARDTGATSRYVRMVRGHNNTAAPLPLFNDNEQQD